MEPYDKNAFIEFCTLKWRLAELLEWDAHENLSWFRLWDGNWSFLGRRAVSATAEQRSIVFSVDPHLSDPIEAIQAAINKVKSRPSRVNDKLRWFCPKHEWEEILPRGQMSALPLTAEAPSLINPETEFTSLHNLFTHSVRMRKQGIHRDRSRRCSRSVCRGGAPVRDRETIDRS